jgi:hypothetical protein
MKALPDPSPGSLWLVTGPRLAVDLLIDLGARLAVRMGVRFLDAGNRFKAYQFNRTAARCLDDLPFGPGERPNLAALLAKVHLARAFTCYQVHTLLAQTPTSPVPTLVLDLLSTFYDDNVPLVEARRLLRDCLAHLQRLCARAPVAVTACPPPRELADRAALLEDLQASTQQIWVFEEENTLNAQINFFDRLR